MGTDADLRKLHVQDTREILLKLGKTVLIIILLFLGRPSHQSKEMEDDRPHCQVHTIRSRGPGERVSCTLSTKIRNPNRVVEAPT